MTHDLLSGDLEPPGEYVVGVIGGSGISFKRDEGDDEHHVVLDTSRGDGVEVWARKCPTHRILWNQYEWAKTIGTAEDMSNAASIALEYMEEYEYE